MILRTRSRRKVTYIKSQNSTALSLTKYDSENSIYEKLTNLNTMYLPSNSPICVTC